VIQWGFQQGRLAPAPRWVAWAGCFLVMWLFCWADSAVARLVNIQPLRPDHYTIEIQSTRSDDKPRLVSTWAHVFYEGEHYRALVPANIVRGSDVRVDFRWAPGSTFAGQVEKVEMEWKHQRDVAWRSRLLGEGFREPGSGHLILSPAKINFSSDDVGEFDFRFLMRDPSGRMLQDGGTGSTLKVQVAPHQPSAIIRFTESWNISQQGQLIAGKSFELNYALERIEQQLAPVSANATSPWCLFAKVQFDDGPVVSYPLLAAHFEHPEQVVGLLPTIQIPVQARRMTIWFFAFHNTQTYFDSNFGQNYHFVILPR
jgi:hypothetical protein